MATIIKEFNFVADDEGWLANTSEATIDTGWFPPHGGHGHIGLSAYKPNPLLGLVGGCFKFTAKQNTSQSKNYMLIAKTWEDLGVPAGSIVTNVQGDYRYKWDLDYSGTLVKNINHAEFGGGDTNFGPFELLDDTNNVIDTFSGQYYAIDRGAGYSAPYWKNYPTGGPVYPITYSDPGWGDAIGVNLSVPVAQQPSNSTLFFKIHNITPSTAAWTHGDYMMWVRLKIDHIVLTITYEVPITSRPTLLSFDKSFKFLNNQLA